MTDTGSVRSFQCEACGSTSEYAPGTDTLRCPHCAHRATETMPTDACQFFYDCKNCGERLKPRQGDCCVFCSYGSVPCPPMQAGNCCG